MIERNVIVSLGKSKQSGVIEQRMEEQLKERGFKVDRKKERRNGGRIWVIEYESQQEKQFIISILRYIEQRDGIELTIRDTDTTHQNIPTQSTQSIYHQRSHLSSSVIQHNIPTNSELNNQLESQQSQSIEDLISSSNNDQGGFEELSVSSDGFEVLDGNQGRDNVVEGESGEGKCSSKVGQEIIIMVGEKIEKAQVGVQQGVECDAQQQTIVQPFQSSLSIEQNSKPSSINQQQYSFLISIQQNPLIFNQSQQLLPSKSLSLTHNSNQQNQLIIQKQQQKEIQQQQQQLTNKQVEQKQDSSQTIKIVAQQNELVAATQIQREEEHQSDDNNQYTDTNTIIDVLGNDNLSPHVPYSIPTQLIRHQQEFLTNQTHHQQYQQQPSTQTILINRDDDLVDQTVRQLQKKEMQQQQGEQRNVEVVEEIESNENKVLVGQQQQQSQQQLVRKQIMLQSQPVNPRVVAVNPTPQRPQPRRHSFINRALVQMKQSQSTIQIMHSRQQSSQFASLYPTFEQHHACTFPTIDSSRRFTNSLSQSSSQNNKPISIYYQSETEYQSSSVVSMFSINFINSNNQRIITICFLIGLLVLVGYLFYL